MVMGYMGLPFWWKFGISVSANMYNTQNMAEQGRVVALDLYKTHPYYHQQSQS